MIDKPKRRWFRFNLRSLLVLVTIACVGFGWLGVKVRAKQREREAVKALRDLGGEVRYDYEFNSNWSEVENPTPPGPEWLRELLGNDIFACAVSAHCGPQTTDVDLRHLAAFGQLRALYLGETQITDEGMVHLRGLNKLEWLSLPNIKITDAGMIHIAELSKLIFLYVNGTHMTNAGLVNLAALSELRWLCVRDTQVTDSGKEEIRKTLPNMTIAW
jgi:hypothetical protein